MLRKNLVVVMCLSVLSGPVVAGEFFGNEGVKDKPSVINYGWSGMVTGVLLGTAVGGLQAEREHERLDDNGEGKRILNGALYGVIGGTVLGLGIGFYDLAEGQTGVGGIVLRDTNRGGCLGAVIGAAVGGITYSKTKEWGDLGKNAAWGYISGSALGLVFGLIEGPRIVSANSDCQSIRLVMVQDSQGNPCPQLQLCCRY